MVGLGRMECALCRTRGQESQAGPSGSDAGAIPWGWQGGAEVSLSQTAAQAWGPARACLRLDATWAVSIL